MANFVYPINPSSSGPVQFVKDGVVETVNQDTTVPANSIPLPVTVLDASGIPTDVARESKQDVQIVEAISTNTKLETVIAEQLDQTAELVDINSELDSIAAIDFATETTLDALNTKVVAVDTGAVVVASSALPTGASTLAEQQTQSTALAALNTRMAGSLAPVAHDEIEQTYVGATTDLNTVIYKLGGVTVRTLTFSYDGQGRLDGVVAS